MRSGNRFLLADSHGRRPTGGFLCNRFSEPPKRRDGTLVAFIFITVLLGGASMAQAEPLDALKLRLPDSILTWTKGEQDILYDDRTIFDYIDGAAEVYRAYNMQGCLSRRYETPGGPAVILDIFDMGSSEDAFGVFTYDQDGKELELGQGAFYRAGWLSMWKHRYFVSIYTEQETEATQAAVRELAEAVSRLIPIEGPKPRILDRLPSKGIRPGSVKFFHDPVVLNRHYYLSGDNILGIGRHIKGALASYERKEGSALLLLLEYPDPEKAGNAHAALLKHYIPEADAAGMALLENKQWCALKIQGNRLAVVLESTDQELAKALLQEVTAKGP
jgi:hypothetical protein